MGISRSEAYRRGVGKEEEGLAVAEDFFESVLGIPLARILGREDNYEFGDFETPLGTTIECKRQPIDPGRFKRNFVEVCEAVHHDRHQEGHAVLGAVLDLTEDALRRMRWVNRKTHESGKLGDIARISVSIKTFVKASCVVYVNPAARRHLYVYDSRELLQLVRSAVVKEGLVRAAGQSNDDTFAVYVPNSDLRWSASWGEGWVFNGPGAPESAIARIQGMLQPR